MDDLMEELRQKNIMSIEEVKYAILETTGKLSVFAFEKNRNIKVSDLNLSISDSPLPMSVITGGELISKNLVKLGLDEKWLKKQLSNNKISNIKDILYIAIDANKKTFIIKKYEDEKK